MQFEGLSRIWKDPKRIFLLKTEFVVNKSKQYFRTIHFRVNLGTAKIFNTYWYGSGSGFGSGPRLGSGTSSGVGCGCGSGVWDDSGVGGGSER